MKSPTRLIEEGHDHASKDDVNDESRLPPTETQSDIGSSSFDSSKEKKKDKRLLGAVRARLPRAAKNSAILCEDPSEEDPVTTQTEETPSSSTGNETVHQSDSNDVERFEINDDIVVLRDSTALAPSTFGDILCGRAFQRSKNREANHKFRAFLWHVRRVYDEAPLQQKGTVCIMTAQHLQDHGGRFVEYDEHQNRWSTLSHKRILNKISQTFRDFRTVYAKEGVKAVNEAYGPSWNKPEDWHVARAEMLAVVGLAPETENSSPVPNKKRNAHPSTSQTKPKKPRPTSGNKALKAVAAALPPSTPVVREKDKTTGLPVPPASQSTNVRRVSMDIAGTSFVPAYESPAICKVPSTKNDGNVSATNDPGARSSGRKRGSAKVNESFIVPPAKKKSPRRKSAKKTAAVRSTKEEPQATKNVASNKNELKGNCEVASPPDFTQRNKTSSYAAVMESPFLHRPTSQRQAFQRQQKSEREPLPNESPRRVSLELSYAHPPPRFSTDTGTAHKEEELFGPFDEDVNADIAMGSLDTPLPGIFMDATPRSSNRTSNPEEELPPSIAKFLAFSDSQQETSLPNMDDDLTTYYRSETNQLPGQYYPVGHFGDPFSEELGIGTSDRKPRASQYTVFWDIEESSADYQMGGPRVWNVFDISSSSLVDTHDRFSSYPANSAFGVSSESMDVITDASSANMSWAREDEMDASVDWSYGSISHESNFMPSFSMENTNAWLHHY